MKKFFLLIVLIFWAMGLEAAYLYIDNFNKIYNRTLSGGAFGTAQWGTNGASSGVASIGYDSQNPFGGLGNSLKFTYSVFTNGDVGLMWFNIKGDPPEAVNLTTYNYLSFWIRGEVGGEVIRFRMKEKDTTQESSWVDIRNFLPGGRITTSWQKVVIPITSFRSFDNTVAGTFMIKAEFDGFGIGHHSGTIYIDEILLSTGTSLIYVDTMEVDELVLETWGVDNDSLNIDVLAQQGGAGSPQSYKTNTYETDHTNYQGISSYKLNHIRGAVPGSFAQTVWVLGNPPFVPALDISACDKISFAIKSELVRTLNQGPRIHLDDGGFNEHIAMPPIDTSWKVITTNISAFGGGLNKADIRNFRLSTEADQGTAIINSVWVDEIKFLDTIRPQTPTNIQVNGIKLTNNFQLSIENNFTSTVFSNETLDKSLEAVMLEYRVDKGPWKLVNFDYNTSKNNFTNYWSASGLSSTNKIDLRISSFDCSTNRCVQRINTNYFTNCRVPTSYEYAFIDLSVDPPTEYKMDLKSPETTSYTNPVGGSGARRTSASWNSFYFDIEDGFAYQVLDDTYYYVIAIEYFDNAVNKQFYLLYDNRENLSLSQNFNKVRLLNIQDTLTWRTNYTVIKDAYFGNRADGADFFIQGEDKLFLKKVTVYKILAANAAVKLVLKSMDSEPGVGTLNSIIVEAVDSFNSSVPNYSGAVEITTTGSSMVDKTSINLIDGQGAFYLNNSKEESITVTAEKTGLNQGVLPLSFKLFYGLNQSKNVNMTLSHPAITSNLYFGNLAQLQEANIGGQDCYRTGDAEFSLMVFDIDNNFVYDRLENDGYVYDITIEYFDKYTSTDDDINKKYIILKYDSIGMEKGSDGYYIWTLADQQITRENSNIWKTFTFSITDPRFGNRLDLIGDFALSAYDPIYIRRVMVSRRNYYFANQNADLVINTAKANLTIKKDSITENVYIIPNNLISLPKSQVPVYTGYTYSINNANLISGCDFLVYNENRSKKLDNFYLKNVASLELLYKQDDLTSDVNENNLTVYFYNINNWEKKGGDLNKSLKKMSLNVDHLSLYGIFESNPGKDFLIQWRNNPFSPNNDGIMDTGILHVVLSKPANTLRTFIYDLKGAFVRELEKHDASVGQTFEWDGKDSRGKNVPIGVYVYQVEYDGKVYNGLVGVVR